MGSDKSKITVIFTCHNRKEMTLRCVESLSEGNPNCELRFIVVDDGSTDGTTDELKELQESYRICLIKGDGNLYYSGGMRVGMERAREEGYRDTEYILLVNDDVDFYAGAIEQLIAQSREQGDACIVGAVQTATGEQSYGAIRYTRGIRYEMLRVDQWKELADTFGGNCVLIPHGDFVRTEGIDACYLHTLGDFDYGLQLKRNGVRIHSSKEFVGICEKNSVQGTWMDRSLSVRERIQKKEAPKGAPSKQWFHYLKKNLGMKYAVVHTITPYIKILMHIGR